MSIFDFFFRNSSPLAQQKNTLFVRAIHNNTHLVALVQLGICIRHFIMSVRMYQARNHKFHIAQCTQLFDGNALHLRVGKQHIEVLYLLLYTFFIVHTFLLFFNLDIEEQANKHHRDQNTDHAQRVCHSVSRSDVRIGDATHIGIRLLRCTQTGSICYCTEQHTCHCGNINPRKQMNNKRCNTPEQHNSRCQQVKRQTALTKRREKTGTDL